VWSLLCGVRIHAEEKRGSHQAEGISEQKIISLRNWGYVLTPFVGTCRSIGKAADEEWIGAGSKKKKRAHLAFRAGGGVAADEAMERAGRCSSRKAMERACYLLNFVWFKLGRFILCVASCNLVVSEREVRVRL